MSQEPIFVQIEANEDVTSVRDRLSFVRGGRVLLIWPESGTALTRKLDLVLIQREAKRRAIQLALVTHDPDVRQHARELQMSAFMTIDAAVRRRWQRGRTRVFVHRRHKPEAAPHHDDLMPLASRLLGNRKRFPPWLRITTQILAFVILLVFSLGLAAVIIPSATIQVRTATQTITTEVLITVDPEALDVDVENARIPATRLRTIVQTVQQVSTTGIEPGDNTLATGFVTFTNQTPNPVNIPAGTRVTLNRSNAPSFETVEASTVPGGLGQSVEVPIRADQRSAGPRGNVDAGTITLIDGPLEESLQVRNAFPTIGGDSRSFQVVTQDDRERIDGHARAQLQTLAYAEMEANLLESQTILIQTITIPDDELRSDWVSYSHPVGARSATLSLDMRAVVTALAIDDRFARQIVFAQLSATKPPDLVIEPDSFLYTRGEVRVVGSPPQITFTALGDADAVAAIRAEDLAHRLRGLSIAQAHEEIVLRTRLAEETAPQIDIRPSWWRRMPVLPFRIEVEVRS